MLHKSRRVILAVHSGGEVLDLERTKSVREDRGRCEVLNAAVLDGCCVRARANRALTAMLALMGCTEKPAMRHAER